MMAITDSVKLENILKTTDEKKISNISENIASSNVAKDSPMEYLNFFTTDGEFQGGDKYGMGKFAKKILENAGVDKLVSDITESDDVKNLFSKMESLGLDEEDLKNLSSKTFSKEDRKIAILQMEIQEIKNKIEADRNYIDKELKAKDAKDKNLINQLSEFPAKLKKDLEKMNQSLKESISSALEDIEYEDALEILLTNLVETFEKALAPFLQVPNMPPIPIIGDLADIIKTLSEMGRIQHMINSKLRPKDKEKWKKEQEEKNKNTTVWQRVRDSKAGQLIREIAQTIWEVIKMLPQIINFFWLALLKELIDLLKPVFDAFGIVAGTFMGLLDSVPEFLTSSWNMAMTFGYILLKYAWNKIESVFNIFMLIGSVETDAETQERIILEEVEDLEKQIKEKEATLDELNEKKKTKEIEKALKKFEKSKKIKKTVKNILFADSAEEQLKKALPASEKSSKTETTEATSN